MNKREVIRALEIASAVSSLVLLGWWLRESVITSEVLSTTTSQETKEAPTGRFWEHEGERPLSVEVSTGPFDYGAYLVFENGKRLLLREHGIREWDISPAGNRVVLLCQESVGLADAFEGERRYVVRILYTDGSRHQRYDTENVSELRNLVWSSNNSVQLEIIGLQDPRGLPVEASIFARQYIDSGRYEFTFDENNSIVDRNTIARYGW